MAAPVEKPRRAVVATMRGAGEEGLARTARRATARVKRAKAVMVGLRVGLAMFARPVIESGTYR